MNRRTFTKLLGLGIIGTVVSTYSNPVIPSEYHWYEKGFNHHGTILKDTTLEIFPSIDIVNKYNMTHRRYVNYMGVNDIPQVVKASFNRELCGRIDTIDKSNFNEEFVDNCVKYARFTLNRKHIYCIYVSFDKYPTFYNQFVFLRTGTELCKYNHL